MTDVTDGHAVQGKEDGRALRADGREVLILVVADRCASKVVTSKGCEILVLVVLGPASWEARKLGS